MPNNSPGGYDGAMFWLLAIGRARGRGRGMQIMSCCAGGWWRPGHSAVNIQAGGGWAGWRCWAWLVHYGPHHTRGSVTIDTHYLHTT